MGRRISLFLATMLALAVLGPAVPVQAENAPYVNAAVADTEFSSITAQCMDVIRSKKILLVSYSWGLGMRSGLYTLPDTYGSIYNMVGVNYSADYNVRDAGGDYNVIPSNAFSLKNFIHYIGSGDENPEGMGQLLRNSPWYFKDVVNVGMVFGDGAWGTYSTVMDAMRSEFPNIKFIYTTVGFHDSTHTDNIDLASWSATLRARHKGQVPLYDLGFMFNDDGRCGDQYCPEYSTDPAGIHPNTKFINERLAKGFLVMLYKLYCETPSTYCGDSSCNNGETCSTCSGDCGTCPSGLPDLIITDISWSPANPQPGNAITFSATIKNQGTAATPSGVLHGVLFTVDGSTSVWSASYTNSLAAGASVTVTANGGPAGIATWSATSGSHTVEAYVDDVNRMAESNENNNKMSETIVVGSATFCGDSSCNNGETCSTCPSDCGTCSSQNPIAWWKFDEASGTSAADSSGNGNTGTLVNGPTWTAGKFGNALQFDGSNDYVTAGSSNVYDNMPAMTLSFWAKTNGYGQYGQGYFISKSNQAWGWHFGPLITGNTVTFGVLYNSVDLLATAVGDTLPTSDFGTWTYWALTWDGSNQASHVHIYKNGVEVSKSTQTDGSTNRLDDNYIDIVAGNNDLYFNRAFDGALDDVRIYSRALSSQEILSLYQSGTCIHESDSTCDGCVDSQELTAFIGRWYLSNADVTLKELMEAIGFWKRGGC